MSGLGKVVSEPWSGCGEATSFEDFKFELENALSISQLTGHHKEERTTATGMITLLEQTQSMSLQEVEGTKSKATFTDEWKTCDKALFAILAKNVTGRAKDIVKEEVASRSGIAAWARLRAIFSRSSGSQTYNDIFRFGWSAASNFEDQWRAWVDKVGRLPKGSLGDGALEALAIEGAKACRQGALEQHMRLNSPQKWTQLVTSVEHYLGTMRNEAVPMEVDQTTASWKECAVCGKKGHTRETCKFAQAKCGQCGKKGHLAAVCRSGTWNKGKGKQGGVPAATGKGRGNHLIMSERQEQHQHRQQGVLACVAESRDMSNRNADSEKYVLNMW